MTGLGVNSSLLQSAVIGGTNLIFTMIAMSIIDRFGRRSLLILGSFGLTFFLAMIARAFFLNKFDGSSVMWFLVGNQVFFAMSQGTIIWVFISEIFPNAVRSKGQALGSFTHWLGAAAVSWTFPDHYKQSGIRTRKSFHVFQRDDVLAIDLCLES